MSSFIIYPIEIAISLALFYLAYWIFLKNETFFKLNRFYLVASVLISLFVPLLNIGLVTSGEDSFLTRHLILPIQQLEQRIIGIDRHIVTNNKTAIPLSRESITGKKATSVSEAGDEADHLKTGTLNSAGSKASHEKVSWSAILSALYLAGAALLLIRFLVNFVRISGYIFKNRPQLISGMRVIRFEKDISPFSFLNHIFISGKEYPEAELNRIISHEKVHIRQKHSIDLILFELLLVFQWFNPFAWYYKRAIKINHEYLADLGTINSGVDVPGYQYSLLDHALRENNFDLASSYNLSVKKRIAMMMQKRSPKLAALKLIVALPVLFFLFSAFAFNPDSFNVNEHKKNVLTVNKDSIKEVSVPVEYLKLLEGEYVSTNEPNRERRIIFTELLGHLYGCDGGYTYKILPVGGEQFMNPDDNASLIFNSKDKNAISLLLFGKIILNKKSFAKGAVNAPKRSLAFTLANVMLKNDIQSGLSFYKAAKDSGNYSLAESQMNYAGYVLLQSKKVKEAAAIFKLNTELYPESFNTYDSYAEALLELGDKTQAIENYKKSIRLNPGSENGLQKLKQLGVNTVGLVKTVDLSKEYLKLLEGNYLSTNENNWVRWIRLELEKGVLYGTDNGYHYRLIPMGDGKFINPDDGASLVFDTKNKKEITFSLFGRVNLKKVTMKEPGVDLNKYVGLYLPQKEDPIQKPMEIFLEGNKIFRRIPSDPEGPNRTIELQLVTDNEFFYTDNSGRSLQFILDDKKEVTAGLLRRYEGVYKLIKQK